jgi:type IV secretory pathway TrbF-like protein
VAEFAYCKRSWKFASLGFPRTAAKKRLESGKRWHRRQGLEVTYSKRLRFVAVLVLLIALACLGLGLFVGGLLAEVV